MTFTIGKYILFANLLMTSCTALQWLQWHGQLAHIADAKYFPHSEPVLCEGLPNIEILQDGWTVVTEDGRRYTTVSE